MNEEYLSDYLQNLCIDNNLQLLRDVPKKYNTIQNKIYLLDTSANIDDIQFMKNNKSKKIKVSKDKQKQREYELIKKQLKNIPSDKKFRKSDIHRIVKHTDTSIFDADKCCIWSGYVTNLNDSKKGTYINFYFKDKKKVALHRLLYINYKGELNNTDYIKYSCENKGKCCNINHMTRFEYNLDEVHEKEEEVQKNKKTIKNKLSKDKTFVVNNDFKISFY